MNTPIQEAIAWSISGLASPQYDPIDVVTAAKPTRAWKPATHYGSSVTATLDPTMKPPVPPIAIRPKAYIKTLGAKLQAINVVIKAPATPTLPNV